MKNTIYLSDLEIRDLEKYGYDYLEKKHLSVSRYISEVLEKYND